MNDSDAPAPFYRLPPNRVWRTYQGGAVLDAIEGKARPVDSHFPEDWIGSVTRAVNPGREEIIEGLSTLLDARDRPFSFPALLASAPGYFLGERHLAAFGPHTMLLVKYLDAAIRLHFQCHPTAAFARLHLGSSSGKAEAYYILAIREGTPQPCIYLGFQRPPARADFRRWIETQDLAAIEACFDKIPVSPGDALYIPGGFPHAIGEGILMVEIMEPSDLAVRFEFSRGGFILPESARFMNRGLDFCLDIFDFRATPAEEVRERFFSQPQWLEDTPAFRLQSLIDSRMTDRFRVQKLSLAGAAPFIRDGLTIGIVLSGSLTLHQQDARLSLRRWDKFLLPAQAGLVQWEGPAEVLLCQPPPVMAC